MLIVYADKGFNPDRLFRTALDFHQRIQFNIQVRILLKPMNTFKIFISLVSQNDLILGKDVMS